MPEIKNWSVKTIYDILYQGILEGKKTITFPFNISAEKLTEVFHKLLTDNPEFFWFTGGGTFGSRILQNCVTCEFTPTAFLTLEEINVCKKELDRRLKSIIACMEAFKTTSEKIRFLHDFLIKETTYDSKTAALMKSGKSNGASSLATGAYGCLVLHYAVCSGVAAAFHLILTRLGIPCARVQGFGRKTGVPHEWNIVKIDGEWCHLDVTWDNPTITGGDSLKGYCSYDYYLISSEEISRTHVFDRNAIPPCTTNKYSYFETNGLALSSYDPATTAQLISRQAGADCIRLKYRDNKSFNAAVDDLITRQGIYKIPAVKTRGVHSLYYLTSDVGTLTIWLG